MAVRWSKLSLSKIDSNDEDDDSRTERQQRPFRVMERRKRGTLILNTQYDRLLVATVARFCRGHQMKALEVCRLTLPWKRCSWVEGDVLNKAV
ncbi:hypothetical protein TKK_0016153 [Trichogramma kaykai]